MSKPFPNSNFPPSEVAPAKDSHMGGWKPNEDEFLTRSMLRVRWKCSDSTIKRREKTGLKATHLGGRTVRYRMAEVLAFEQGARTSITRSLSHQSPSR